MIDDTTSDAYRQTRWALERTEMAFERTFAAWLRTGLAALAFGIAFRSLKADAPGWLIHVIESGLILFGALCFATAWNRLSQFRSLYDGKPSLAMRLLPVMSLVLLGASIAALFDVWL